MRKAIIVGDKPSSRMKPGAKPFEGASCEKRLKEWIKYLGLENPIIFNSYKLGHEDCLKLQCAEIYDDKIICLGELAYLRITALGYDAFKLPHPSGLNRQNNNKEFIEQKLKECKKWLHSK